MTQPLSSTGTQQLDTRNLKGHKPLLGTLRKHLETGDFRARITAQLRPGTAHVPFWYGPAQLQITGNTQATIVAQVVKGRIVKFSMDLSKPVVLLNPVGSLVPSYIPGADTLNNRAISIEGMDLTSDGHVVPRGNIKMYYFSVPIHKFIPLQFCPVINTDASHFFKGKLVKSVTGNPTFNATDTLRSWLRLVMSYDVLSRIRPALPLRRIPIELIDAAVRGTVQASPTTDEFISEPESAHLCLTVNKQKHVATLVQPHVRVSPAGQAHIRSQVELQRAVPYGPLPLRSVDVDVSLQKGDCSVHAHSGGLLRDLAELQDSGQPS